MDVASSEVFSGIHAAAAALHSSADVVAFVGGEGAKRVFEELLCLSSEQGSGPMLLPEEGAAAAAAAIGFASAGKRVVVLASGAGVLGLLPLLWRVRRLDVGFVVVCPAHGADVGAVLPSAAWNDVSALLSAPVRLRVAENPVEIVREIRSASAAKSAVVRGVVFGDASVGLALTAGSLRSVMEAPAEDWSALSAAKVLSGNGPVALVSMGREALEAAWCTEREPSAGRTISVRSLVSLGKIPWESLLQGCSRVVVHEHTPWSEEHPLLAAQVRAACKSALVQVVSGSRVGAGRWKTLLHSAEAHREEAVFVQESPVFRTVKLRWSEAVRWEVARRGLAQATEAGRFGRVDLEKSTELDVRVTVDHPEQAVVVVCEGEGDVQEGTTALVASMGAP